MSAILLPLVNGLSQAMLLFLIASGLTLVFGVMKILNFSHGAFFMLGAYIGYSMIQSKTLSPLLFFSIVLLTGIIVSLIGGFVEVLILRRIYHVDEIFALLATFALLLVFQGLVHEIWGGNYLSVSFPKGLGGGVNVMDMTIPLFSLLVILIGLFVGAILWFFIQKTRYGKLIQASAEDSKMTNALGVNVPLIYTVVFCIGAFLAGMAGLIAAPINVLTPTLAMTYIAQAFGVIVVGGLGNIQGALLAAVILSLIDSYVTAFVPVLASVAFFIGMAMMLLLKPKGLFS